MLNAPGRLAGLLLRATPYRFRFVAAVRMASGVGGIVELVAVLRGSALRLGSGAEYALARLVEIMDTHHIAFKPSIDVVGMDQLELATNAMHGIVLVTTHANAGLSRMVLWPLDVANLRAVVISAGSSFPICGTGRTAETIVPSGTFLLRVRRKLREGFVVCAMLDWRAAEDSPAHGAAANRGAISIADPLIRVAARWRVPIAIVEASLANGRLLMQIRMSFSGDIDEVVDALSAVITAQSDEAAHARRTDATTA